MTIIKEAEIKKIDQMKIFCGAIMVGPYSSMVEH